MSYPNATIFKLDEHGINEVEYENTEHYAATKEFLNNYERMLSILMEE